MPGSAPLPPDRDHQTDALLESDGARALEGSAPENSAPENSAPEIVVLSSPDDAARWVADRILLQLQQQPTSTLGLATGGTPEGVYRRLVDAANQNQSGNHWKTVTTFNLDEYQGIDANHPQSYQSYMGKHLFDPIGMDRAQTYLPPSRCDDPVIASSKFEDAIHSAGGIDLQLLGIGQNGHIGFNEPGSSRNSRTRQVELTPSTIKANARYFDRLEDVPTHAITMGIGTILEAKTILVMATGKSKANAVAAAVEGPVTSDCPASFLQDHPTVTWVLDRDAAAKLNR